jgi:hypothetical protein
MELDDMEKGYGSISPSLPCIEKRLWAHPSDIPRLEQTFFIRAQSGGHIFYPFFPVEFWLLWGSGEGDHCTKAEVDDTQRSRKRSHKLHGLKR